MKFTKLYPMGLLCLFISACGQPSRNDSSSASNLNLNLKDCNETVQSIPIPNEILRSNSTYSYTDDAVLQTSQEENPFRSVNQFMSKTQVVKTPVKENQWEILREQNNIQPIVYTIDPAIGDTIVYEPSGTTIVVPPDAFELNGVAVTEKVTIEYREFHTIKDIFFSGIPMDILLNGEKNIFESNGMFELKTTVNTIPCEIVDENPLVVNMSVNGPNEDFNFYALNSTTNQWDQTNELVINKGSETKTKDDSYTYYTEEIVYEKPSLGIQLLDKNAWKNFTWGQKEDTYFQLVYNSQSYPEFDQFKDAVFQVHQKREKFVEMMGIIDSNAQKLGLGPVYTLCSEFHMHDVEERPGYVNISMKSKEFNSAFESIIYVPELKSKQDFKTGIAAFEKSQESAYINRNAKRDKIRHEHKVDRNANKKVEVSKQSQALNLVSTKTQFESAALVKAPGIFNWDKPYPYLPPPLISERRIEAQVTFADNHMEVGTIYVADITKNRLVAVNTQEKGLYKFNISRKAEMMIWTVDHMGTTGILTGEQIDLDKLDKHPFIKLPCYTLNELKTKLESFSAKVNDHKKGNSQKEVVLN